MISYIFQAKEYTALISNQKPRCKQVGVSHITLLTAELQILSCFPTIDDAIMYTIPKLKQFSVTYRFLYLSFNKDDLQTLLGNTMPGIL